MRRLPTGVPVLLALGLSLLAGKAAAQQTALPPVTVPPATSLPGWPPADSAPGALPAANASPAWLPRGGAELQALDKINARTTTLSVKLGQSVAFGSLTITVRACLVRPADQPADAAAFLEITDSRKDAPGFRGWMLAAEPFVTTLQHPVYDVRVSGCRG